jgi:hypothetical protein
MMNNKLTQKERKYLQLVKQLPCSVCDQPGPSDAHHINQGQQFTAVALCFECHRGSFMGWHGQKKAWQLRKMDEIDALNNTIKRIFESGNMG